MTKGREWIRACAGVCALLLLFGTVISFFFDPYVPEDVRGELPENALITDSARDPWLSVDEKGAACVYAERCVYLDELVIPEAINGIKVITFYTDSSQPAPWIRKITLPSTLRHMSEFPFHEWDGLEEIVFKEGIKDLSRMYIGTKPNLKKLVIPSSVKSIRYGLLETTPETLEIHFGGTEEQWLAMGAPAEQLLRKYTVIYESNGIDAQEQE